MIMNKRWATCLVLISIAYGSSSSDFTANASFNISNNRSFEDPSSPQSAESIIDEIERVNNLTYKSAVNNFPQHDNHSRAGFQRNLMVVLPVMQGVSNMSDAKLEMLYTKEPITTVIYTEGTPETLTDVGEQYKDASKNVGIKKSRRNKTQRKDNFHEWNSETGYLSKPSENSPLDYGYPDSLKFVRELNELPKNHKPDWVSPEAYVTTTELSTDFPPDSTSSPFEIFKSVKPLEINKLLSTIKLKYLPATTPLTTEVENTTTLATEEETTTKRKYSTRTKKKQNNNRNSVSATRRSAKKPSVKFRNTSAKHPSKSSDEINNQQPYKFEDVMTSQSEVTSESSNEPDYSTKSTVSTPDSNEIPDGSVKGYSNKSSITDSILNDSNSTYKTPNKLRITTPSYYNINKKFTKQLLESRSSSASTFLPTVLSNTKSYKSVDNLSTSRKNNKSSIIPFEVAPKFLPTPIHEDQIVVDISGNQLLSDGVALNNTSKIGRNDSTNEPIIVKVENVTFSPTIEHNIFSNLTYSKKINENLRLSVDSSGVNKSEPVPTDFSIHSSTDSNNFSQPLELNNAQHTNVSDEISPSPEPIKTSTEPNKLSSEPFNSKLNEIYKFLNNSIENIKSSKSAEPMNFPNIDKLLNDYNVESASFISKSKSTPAADDKKAPTKPITFNYINKNIKLPFANEKHSSNFKAFSTDILTPEMKSMLASLGLYKNENLFTLTPTTPSPLTTIAGNEIPFEKIISENKQISPEIDPEAYVNFKKIPTSYRSEKKFEAKISDDIKQYLVSFGLLPREEKDPKEVILLRMSRGNNDRPRIGRNIVHNKNLGSESFHAEKKDDSNSRKLPQDVMETLTKLQLPTSFHPIETKSPGEDHVFSPSVYLEKLNNTSAGLKVNAAIESIRKLSENHNKSNLTIEEIKFQLENITSTLSTAELTELAFSNALDNVFINETSDNSSDKLAPTKTSPNISPTLSSTTKLPYIANGISSKKGSNKADLSPIKKLNVIASLPNPLSSEELKQLYENSKNEIKRQQPTEKTQMLPIVFGVLLPNANNTSKMDKPSPSDATHPSETLSSTVVSQLFETPGSSDDLDLKGSSIDEPSPTENTSSAAENSSSVAQEPFEIPDSSASDDLDPKGSSIDEPSSIESTSSAAENSSSVAPEPLEIPDSSASNDLDSKSSSIDEPSSTENTSSAAENSSSVAPENPSTTIENTSTVTESPSATAENTTTVGDEVSSTAAAVDSSSLNSTSSRDSSSTDDASSSSSESSVPANPPLQELAESFGGGETASEAASVADLPSPRPNGLYFYVDWNSFFRVGDTNPVDLRFSPKAGNPRNFVNITFPYSAY